MIELRTKFSRPLGRFVDCFWYSDGEPRSHRKERLLPTGCVDFVIKLWEDRSVRVYNEEHDAAAKSYGGAVVSGAYSRHFAIDTAQSAPTVGIHFRPGGAAPFLGLPVSELMDQHVGLEEVWGRPADIVRERLMEASTPASMFGILEQALLDRLAEPFHEYTAMLHAVDAFSVPATVSVKTVHESMGFGAKRFIRLFQDSVGLTPKRYCRVRRFQSVLDQIVGGEPFQWAHVAQDHGYYDQSHLIRDFREFTGMTPMEYEPVRADRRNHIVLSE